MHSWEGIFGKWIIRKWSNVEGVSESRRDLRTLESATILTDTFRSIQLIRKKKSYREIFYHHSVEANSSHTINRFRHRGQENVKKLFTSQNHSASIKEYNTTVIIFILSDSLRSQSRGWVNFSTGKNGIRYGWVASKSLVAFSRTDVTNQNHWYRQTTSQTVKPTTRHE